MGLDRVRIVLVRPRGAGNVGATARAMKNMGLADLVLVQPAPVRRFWAHALAAHAVDVLEAARTVASLPEAVADCGLVVGTTARGGPYRARRLSPREIAPEILGRADRQRVALVFGPEDHGLTNEDLKACHRVVAIPASPVYPSLNLAQAVIICAYELYLAAGEGQVADEAPEAARADRLQFLCERLQTAFLKIGFLQAENPDHIMFAVRQLFGRAALDEREVRIFLALARQIEWFGTSGWKAAAPQGAAGEPVE